MVVDANKIRRALIYRLSRYLKTQNMNMLDIAAAKNSKSDVTGYCAILVTQFHVVAQSFFPPFSGILV